MDKPIVRWTIGGAPISDFDRSWLQPLTNEGLECLKFAVDSFKKIYKDQFDYLVCYNHLQEEQVEYLNTIGVELYDQSDFIESVSWPRPKAGTAWKLFAPRFRYNSHEILMDNDIIIHDPISELDNFLSSNDFLISEGLERQFGRYDHWVKAGAKLSTGVLGLPPRFNLTQAISQILPKLPAHYNPWITHFDEQGMLCSIVSHRPYILIPTKKIFVCCYTVKAGECGEHWAGINYGRGKDWRRFYETHSFEQPKKPLMP
jgi:hypothetical protein